MKTMINGAQLRAECEMVLLLSEMGRPLVGDEWADAEQKMLKDVISRIDEMLREEE